jgi:parallel beta-helix repeat protein
MATPPSASPTPTTGTYTNLSVLGADSDGESTLIYSWSVVSAPSGASGVTFSANNANWAKYTTAFFGEAGVYTFQVTATDLENEQAFATVSVDVLQTVTSLSIAPASSTVARLGSTQFSIAGLDQFGQPMNSLPTVSWWVDGGMGTVNSTGDYTGPAWAGTATVCAHSGGANASASVSVSSAPQVWYIGTSGQDNAPGTLAQPLADMTPIENYLLPGDQVQFLGGTYNLTSGIWVGNSGTSSAPIVLEAAPGQTVVLDGSALAAGTTAVDINGSYIDVQGLQVTNAPGGGITDWGGSNDIIENNVVSDSQSGGIFVGYSSPGVVSNVLVQRNTVTGNVQMNSARTASSGWAAAIAAKLTSYVTFEQNTVYDNYGEGIDVDLSDHGLVSQNVAYDNYSANYYMDNATYTTITGNLSYSTNNPNFFHAGLAANGIQAANETSANSNPLDYDTVTNNVVIGGADGFGYGSYGNGGGLKNFVVAFNTFYNQSVNAIYIDGDPGHSNTVIEDNVFDAGAGGQLFHEYNSSGGLAGIYFNHNLWYGGSPGVAAGPGDVYVNPQFVNPGGTDPADYRLGAASPALGAGVSIPGVSTDYFGASRGLYADLGAVEPLNPTPSYGSGFTGGGLQINGSAARTNSTLLLTDGGTNEAGSAFYEKPVNITQFTTSFDFQLTNASADGFTFTLQGNNPTALGWFGGGLGYAGIANSVAVKFDLYNNAGEGNNSVGVYTNGAVPELPSTDLTGSGIDLHSGHVFHATITYNGSTLTLALLDTVTNATFSTSWTVNIAAAVGGNTAYVGFTGGTGGLTASQAILGWSYGS